MVSSVQGPLDEATAGNPGIRQAKMRSCSSAQLLCRASSQSRNRRMPSQRICTHKQTVSSGYTSATEIHLIILEVFWFINWPTLKEFPVCKSFLSIEPIKEKCLNTDTISNGLDHYNAEIMMHKLKSIKKVPFDYDP